jgi:DNA replication licensing factor MCM5
MPTILSRFDMIFIVKDEHDQQRDMTLARHIMNVHMNAGQVIQEPKDGELSLEFIKKYINYCRTCVKKTRFTSKFYYLLHLLVGDVAPD